jgi:hypothetical protein
LYIYVLCHFAYFTYAHDDDHDDNNNDQNSDDRAFIEEKSDVLGEFIKNA